MISDFRHKGLKRFYENGDRSKLPAAMMDRIELIVGLLDAIENIQQINIPGFRLHQLTGDRKGSWSVTVSANWRITFTFENGQVGHVDFEDYH